MGGVKDGDLKQDRVMQIMFSFDNRKHHNNVASYQVFDSAGCDLNFLTSLPSCKNQDSHPLTPNNFQ